MMLYVCPVCGTWQDMSLVRALTERWSTALSMIQRGGNLTIATPGYEEIRYFCPEGHGPMVYVQPQDKLFVRQQVVEADRLEVGEG